MAFVDEMEFYMRAGKGGDGVVRWLHEKGKEFSGPAGGNGGKGGDIYAVASRDLGLLARYRNTKEFLSENGGDGESSSRHGKNGEDLFIEFPIGSVITNKETGRQIELLKEGDKALLLSGGRGGLGNEHFKGSRNTTPRESTPGAKGEEANFSIELRLIADFGLIGFPNAGKTSLLNALTNAKAKIGDYAFTTLEPNLGAFYGRIIADIPGLIEGASEGKGLGHKFLRHIRRTRLLIHCISLEQESIADSYKAIRGELGEYAPELLEKPELVVLTKSDLMDKEELQKKQKEAKALGRDTVTISVLDDASLKTLADVLLKLSANVQS